MNKQEMVFVENRFNTEIKLYYNAMKYVVALGLFLPFTYCFIKLIFPDKENLEQDLQNTYWIFAITTATIIAIILISYFVTIHKYYKDKTQGKKIVVQSIIQGKRHVNANFYLQTNSGILAEILVSADDFNKIEVGDEINLEFALYSKLYFGFF